MKERYPVVSVIVPIYKAEKYLQNCISSIRRQTYMQLEIILVDDGSPDDCGNICDKNAAEDIRIKVIHKENEGLSSARNVGLDIARGEYIAFVDADDTIHPQFIEILLRLCLQYDCDIAQCDYLAIAENSFKLPLNPQQSIVLLNNKDAVHELCSGGESVKYTVVWNKIYKKSLFAGIRYPVGRIHEDEFITYKVLWNTKKMAVTNQYLYYYLQHASSITGEQFSIRRLDALDAYKERLCFLAENHLEKDYYSTLQRFFYLIERYEFLTKENIEKSENILITLSKEKEKVLQILPSDFGQTEKPYPMDNLINKDCIFSTESRIVIYGAGYWGNIYYNWINENFRGKIVGWIDNSWYAIGNQEYTVLPLDSLLKLLYDYVLIAIKNVNVQEEVRKNLISWGVPKNKIIAIRVD